MSMSYNAGLQAPIRIPGYLHNTPTPGMNFGDLSQMRMDIFNQGGGLQGFEGFNGTNMPGAANTTGNQLSFGLGNQEGGGSGLSSLLGNLTPSQIGGGLALGGGIAGLAAQLFGDQPDAAPGFTSDDIDKFISQQRQAGSRQIGGQLSRANVSTAGQMASRGLGSSTMTTGALQANQAGAMDAVGQLEAQLGLTRMQAEQFLAQLEAQQQAQQQASQQQFFGGIADIGGLLLSIPTGGASIPASQGIKALL